MQPESSRPSPAFRLLAQEFSSETRSWSEVWHALWTELRQGALEQIAAARNCGTLRAWPNP